MSERMWPEGTEFLTGADTEHSWVRLDQAIAVVAELEAENANFESGARCDRDEIEGLKAERDALRHARLPCREAEVAQRRYEQAEAELAAVGSDLQDEAEYNITLRERAEQAEAERDMAIELVTMARQTFDADGNGTRFLSEIREDVLKDVKRLAKRGAS